VRDEEISRKFLSVLISPHESPQNLSAARLSIKGLNFQSLHVSTQTKKQEHKMPKEVPTTRNDGTMVMCIGVFMLRARE